MEADERKCTDRLKNGFILLHWTIRPKIHPKLQKHHTSDANVYGPPHLCRSTVVFLTNPTNQSSYIIVFIISAAIVFAIAKRKKRLLQTCPSQRNVPKWSRWLISFPNAISHSAKFIYIYPIFWDQRKRDIFA